MAGDRQDDERDSEKKSHGSNIEEISGDDREANNLLVHPTHGVQLCLLASGLSAQLPLGLPSTALVTEVMAALFIFGL